MTDELRNRLWNVVHRYYLYDDSGSSPWSWRLKNLASVSEMHFFKQRVDAIPDHAFQYIREIRVRFYEATFDEVYDYVEWLAEVDGKNETTVAMYCEAINIVLEEEHSAYRLVGSKLAPITNAEELIAVEQAAKSKAGYEGVATHINAAISLLSDRRNPDYRNCIKESVSAVEAAAKTVSGNPKATLGDALKVLERWGKLHPALKEGFSKIYGYTSDAGGIRHALMEQDSITQADARLMLISCSAFCSYLIDRTKALPPQRVEQK